MREYRITQRSVALWEEKGDFAQSHHLFEVASEQYRAALNLEVSTPTERLRISEKLAEALSLGSNPGSAEIWYERLVTLSASYPEHYIIAINALFRTARHLWIASRTEATLPPLAEAIKIAEFHADSRLLKKANTLMANYLILLARYEEAKKFLDDAGETSDEDDAETSVLYWRQKGFLDQVYGQEKTAFAAYEQAIRAAQNKADVYATTIVWSDYAESAYILGKTELAKTCRERALLIARRNNIAWLIPELCLEYADLLGRMGQYELAHEYLLDALSHDVRAPLLDTTLAWVGIPLSLYIKDETTLAKCTLPHTIDEAFMSAEPARVGLVSVAFARLYIKQGNYRETRALLHRAITLMPDISCAWDLPLEIARYGATEDIQQARRLLEERVALPCADVAKAYLCLFNAFIAQRRKRVNDVHAQAHEAIIRFEALHWKGYADFARLLLPTEQRQQNGNVSQERPLASLPTQFTERESEIVALVLKGMTSRAIAERLSISPHTVDSHVASIMGRMGIRSRYQLPYVLAGVKALELQRGTSS